MKIYYDVIQGTEQWRMLRCGVPTASQFSRIITPGGKDGIPKPSKSQEAYRLELLAERLLGEPTDDATSHWQDRGSELEIEAINAYELQRDMDTIKVGFITNDAGTIGASPDRLVGENGLLEIKVGKPSTHIGYLLQDSAAYSDYKIQAQAQLWLAEREWNDLMAYHPHLPPAIYRACRDELFIKAMAEEVMRFSDKLEEQFALCQQKGWVRDRPAPKRTIEPLAPLDDLVKEAMGKGIVVP